MNADYDVLWSDPWLLIQSIGPLTRSRYRLIEQAVAPRLRADARVLDVGCGNGTLLQRLASKHPTIRCVGIEPSAEAIAHADPSIRGAIRHGGFESRLPELYDNPPDVLVSSEVLEHLERPEDALAMMAHALKPGGLAVFTVPARQRYWSSQDEFAGHVQRFEPDDFGRMLETAGFDVTHLYTWGIGPALLYDRLTAWLGPQRTIQAGRSRSGSRLAAWLYHLFRVEDLVRSKWGFQLIAVAQRR